MGGKRPKISISPNMVAKLDSIPVYPEEISIAYLNKKYGKSVLPADAPIGEDGGWVCYPTVKDKDTYMAKVHELLNRESKKRKKAVRYAERERH